MIKLINDKYQDERVQKLIVIGMFNFGIFLICACLLWFVPHFLTDIDVIISNRVFSLSQSFWNAWFSDLTTLFNANIQYTTGFVGVYVIYHIFKNWRPALWFGGGLLIGNGIVMYVLKNLFLRPRPTEAVRLVFARGYSFPSGHSMGAAIILGMIAFLLVLYLPRQKNRPLNAFLLLWTVLTGFSRIYLGVHYFSDVLAGLSFGFSFVAFWGVLYIRYLEGPVKEVLGEDK